MTYMINRLGELKMMFHLSRRFFSIFLILSIPTSFQVLAEGDYKYHASVFAGATTYKTMTDSTLGVDLERRVSSDLGLVLIADFAMDNHAHQIVALGLVYHPIESVKLILAPGVEYRGSASDFLVRFGAGYDFHLPHHITIGPVIDADFVKGHATAWVYGLALGVGF